MRVCVLITGYPSSYTEKKYGDYGFLFSRFLEEEGETWASFDVAKGEYPSEPSSYDVFIITGSASTAHEPEPWIIELNRFIKELYQNRQSRILGVCFGHQALANALGGQTFINDRGWEAGVHQIYFHKEGLSLHYLPDDLESLAILEIHRDHVVELPPEAMLLATSMNTPCQAFAIGDRVLGIQGHPEFEPDIVRDLVESRYEAGVIPEDVAAPSLKSLEHAVDREMLRNILRRFLVGPSN